MNKILPVLILLVLAAAPALAGNNEAGERRVAEMGQLNGVALACRYFDQTRRIKRLLIDNLPKSRELGQLFDDRTNDAYMAFVNSGKACPSPAEFESQVDEAAGRLKAAFRNRGE